MLLKTRLQRNGINILKKSDGKQRFAATASDHQNASNHDKLFTW